MKMSRDEVDKNWIREITRETEHYYQGEIQQETRASWLLALNGVILAILITFVFAVDNKNIVVLIGYYRSLSIIIPFLLSSLFAAFGIFPLIGRKDKKIYRQLRNKSIDQKELINNKFYRGNKREDADYEEYIEHHFLSHFNRNFKKRRWVVFSLFSIILGIVSLLINFLLIF